MAGFRGHFASRSRRYSTALGAIRGDDAPTLRWSLNELITGW